MDRLYKKTFCSDNIIIPPLPPGETMQSTGQLGMVSSASHVPLLLHPLTPKSICIEFDPA